MKLTKGKIHKLLLKNTIKQTKKHCKKTNINKNCNTFKNKRYNIKNKTLKDLY
jgi:hypothetical protein